MVTGWEWRPHPRDSACRVWVQWDLRISNQRLTFIQCLIHAKYRCMLPTPWWCTWENGMLVDLFLITNIHLIDNQCTCVFVGLKKGVEKTINTVTEVILNLKEAVMQAFGQDVVPQSYFVSSKARCKNYLEQEFLSCNCPKYSCFGVRQQEFQIS